ncbi:unnamed protein product [Malus baccata var. baccata]
MQISSASQITLLKSSLPSWRPAPLENRRARARIEELGEESDLAVVDVVRQNQLDGGGRLGLGLLGPGAVAGGEAEGEEKEGQDYQRIDDNSNDNPETEPED